MFNKMKFLAVAVLLAATTMMFSSCSKESRMVGKWKITDVSSNYTYFDNDEGETWTFKDNGTCTIYMMGSVIDGNWEVSKDMLYIDLDRLIMDDVELTITGEFDIDKLDFEEMEISGAWTGRVGDGVGETLKVDYELEKK